MSNEDDKITEVPDVEEGFLALLEQYRVGTKDGMGKTITHNLATTGGENVFENPVQLAERLSKWHQYISPVKRKQLVEQWFAERGIPVPEEALQLAGAKSTEIEKREEKEKKKEAKFFVDDDSGRIRAAKEGETPLTWAEAEKVSDRIKKEAKKESKDDESTATESAFTVGEDGKFTLNPKANIGLGEFAVFQIYQESLKQGQPIDPVEELARREEASVRLKEAMGVKPEDSEMGVLDRLQKLGILKGGGGDDIDFLTKLDTLGLLKKSSGEGESADVKALRQEVSNLTETLRQKELEAISSEVTSVKGLIAALNNKIEQVGRDQSAKGEFDIMSQGISVIDRRLGAIENVVSGFLTKLPSPLSSKQKKRITAAIGDEVETETEVEELGKDLFT